MLFVLASERFLLKLLQLSYESWVGVDLRGMSVTLLRLRRMSEWAWL